MARKVKTIEVKQLTLLPPRKGLCQECATDHEPHYPHDACSLFYLMKFKMQNGRDATWADAMSHCEDYIKQHWTTELGKFGVDINSTKTRVYK